MGVWGVYGGGGGEIGISRSKVHMQSWVPDWISCLDIVSGIADCLL